MGEVAVPTNVLSSNYKKSIVSTLTPNVKEDSSRDNIKVQKTKSHDNKNKEQYFKFNEIMNEKKISLHDISLSTSLPISVVAEIIEKGKGHIKDINKIMGCLNVSIDECVNETILRQSYKEGIIDLKEIFQKKLLINLIKPEPIQLVKSFHEQSETRFFIKVYPQHDKNITQPSHNSQFIITKGHVTEESARKEYNQLLSTRFTNLKNLFPSADNVQVNQIKYNQLELLLEYYKILFDPENPHNLYQVGSVYPAGTIENFNGEYLKKVYAICAKPKAHIIRSPIYSQLDFDNEKVQEHIDLVSMYDISFKDKSIIEFLVPHTFNEKHHYIETTAIYSEIERLHFTIKRKKS